MTIFWDASGVVPLLLSEPRTRAARRALRADRNIVVWWGTSVECLSAVARREREGVLSRTNTARARKNLDELRVYWKEVVPSEELRQLAEDLLLRRSLRAADALQLAAAFVWTGGRPRGHAFLTLDGDLARAAHEEGFDLVLADDEENRRSPRQP